MDKEYFRIYYKNHKKEYQKRDKRWRKKNPKRMKEIKEKYLKNLGKRKKGINKTEYNKGSLKELFIERYGKSLKKTKDDVTHINHKKRMICVDCLEYKTKRCPGWEACKYKEEILEIINEKGG